MRYIAKSLEDIAQMFDTFRQRELEQAARCETVAAKRFHSGAAHAYQGAAEVMRNLELKP